MKDNDDDIDKSMPASLYNFQIYPENEKLLPKQWQCKEKYKFVKFHDNSSSISLTLSSQDYKCYSSEEALVFKADRPISVNLGIYYFEVTLTHIPEDITVCVGVAKYCAPSNKILGTDSNSWALKNSDGCLYHGSNISPQKIGFNFKSEDTLGVGVDFISQNLFYTLNGNLISNAFESKFRIPCTKFEVFPSISLQPLSSCKGAKFTGNFGQKKFLFNIGQHLCEQRRTKESSIIRDYSFNESDNINKSILKYLIYHGYANTVEHFSKHFPRLKNILEFHSLVSIKKRRELMKQCEDRNFNSLIDCLETEFPEVVQKSPELIVQLKCHEFIHYSEDSQIDGQSCNSNGTSPTDSKILEKIEFGRKLVDYVRELRVKQGFISLDTFKIFEQSISLLAYQNPTTSPLKSLYDPGWQKLMSSVINHAILSAKDSSYEKFQTCIDQVYNLFKKTITDNTFIEGQSLGRFLLFQIPFNELSPKSTSPNDVSPETNGSNNVMKDQMKKSTKRTFALANKDAHETKRARPDKEYID